MDKVLFVDDDENILNGLRRRLHARCPAWQTHFATSGKMALELCDRTDMDVVVSDMRMPNMDGSTLLEKIRIAHPATTRIILSGFAEDEAILRTVGPAHQYLAKPCDEELLVSTIEHALDLKDMLQRPALRALMSGIDAIASPPDTYMRLVEVLEDPMAGNDKITAIVSADIALTAEVLKLTNSAYFAITQKIGSVSHAIRMIGMDTLKSLALFIGLFQSFTGPSHVTARLKRLCHRSQQIGVTAALIAEAEGLDKQITMMVPSAGMLSHIGSLVLMMNKPDEMQDVMARVESENISIIDAEAEQFGAAHPEIGAYLLGLWGFPGPVVQSVAFHHTPSRVPERTMTPLAAIYVAQLLCRDINNEKRAKPFAEQIDMAYLAEIGKADRLETWRQIATTVNEQYKTLTK
ncbi:response regulator [Thalassospira profundimaris]|uniref:Response regulator n=1 Tax=Thalassospira profundimaris TaxID=502049 RepID=A0A367X1S9_9PROT|nr:response regulator [Thalassospira profundimaris]RCK47636.1 response regulator [Thalassospira profundimaris]